MSEDRKIKGIFFDLDGVIIDSEGLHQQARTEVFQKNGIKITEEMEEKFAGVSLKHYLVDLCKNEYPELCAETIYKEKWKRFFEIADRLSVVESTVDFIKRNCNRYKMVLVTSAMREFAEKVVLSLNLKDCFEGIIAVSDVEKAKPNPEPYRKALDLVGLNSGEVIAVEDSPSGIEAAQGAGLKCVGLLSTHKSEDIDFADLLVERLDEESVKKILD